MLSTFCAEYLAENTAIKSPETERLMKLSVRHFSAFLERPAQLADVTDQSLARYVQHRRAMGRKDTTIEREVAKLYCLGKAAALRGRNPPLLQRPFKAAIDVPIGFTSDQLRRLFRAAHRYDATICGVPGHLFMTAFCYTLWDSLERAGAVWHVTRDDLDLAGWRGWITFRVRKGNGRTLRRRLRWRTTRYVRRLLAHHDYELAFAMDLDRTSIYHHWGRLLKQAGIPHDRHHGPHCIRRTGGTIYHSLGGGGHEILTHADQRTFILRYLVPSLYRQPQPTDRLRDPLGVVSWILAALRM